VHDVGLLVLVLVVVMVGLLCFLGIVGVGVGGLLLLFNGGGVCGGGDCSGVVSDFVGVGDDRTTYLSVCLINCAHHPARPKSPFVIFRQIRRKPAASPQ